MRSVDLPLRESVSSLCRGHANLLCIVPIFSYVTPKGTMTSVWVLLTSFEFGILFSPRGEPSETKQWLGLLHNRKTVRWRLVKNQTDNVLSFLTHVLYYLCCMPYARRFLLCCLSCFQEKKSLFGLAWLTSRTEQNTKLKWGQQNPNTTYCPLRGDIRKNWNDTEKISMAPAQG